MAMPKSRWVRDVYVSPTNNDRCDVIVSPTRYTSDQYVVADDQLTRQELRAAHANKGWWSARDWSVEALLSNLRHKAGCLGGRPVEPAPVPTPPPAPISPTVTVGGLTRDEVQAMIDAALAPTTVYVERQFACAQAVNGAHKDFAPVLKRVGAGLTVWLHGEAGTGKTTLAIQIAKALELTFRGVSVTAQMTAAQFFGYTTANGDVVRTDWREVWEHGGVFLFDEASSAQPNLAAGVNMALANGICAFPDGMIERHPDCYIIAAANDTGMGATPKYPKGLKQDASFRDRFVFHELTLDENVVRDGVHSRLRDVAKAQAWLGMWRKCRENATKYGLDLVITPRSAFDGAVLIDIGEPFEHALRDAILKGAPSDVAAKVSEGVLV